jgi:hypothetical protein
MSKIVDQSILLVEKDGIPHRFFWIKRWFTLDKVMDKWREIGCWWEDDKEKTFYRVVDKQGIVFEIYLNGEQWNLYKVYD